MKMTHKTSPFQVSLIGAALLAVSLPLPANAQGVDIKPPNGATQKAAFAGQTRAPESKSGVAFDVVNVASGLERPWALAFLPNGRMLVTERPGRLRVVSSDGTMSPTVTGLPAMDARGQGGLLDVILDPD
ncbi:MAG: PQQ-dependent sugar dehydrogenase [Vicinamibacteria bacterium]